MHEQKGSADCFITGGASLNRDVGSGKAIPCAISPEGAGYSNGRKRDVESGYCCKAWDNKANSTALARSIFGASVDRSGKRCSSSWTPTKNLTGEDC